MINSKFGIVLISGVFLIVSCSIEPKPEVAADQRPVKAEKKITTPEFNADSAYLFTKQQVDFGPRVPGTKAHARCAEYLFNKFKNYKLDVRIQTGTIQTFDSKQFKLKNIIA